MASLYLLKVKNEEAKRKTTEVCILYSGISTNKHLHDHFNRRRRKQILVVSHSQTLFSRRGVIAFSISALLEKGSGRVYSTHSY